MEYALETRLDRRIDVGLGSALLIKGWCYHPDKALLKLEIVLGEDVHIVKRHSLTRFDVLREREPDLRGKGHSLNSGFSAVIPLLPVVADVSVQVSLRATFAGGTVEFEHLAELKIGPGQVFAPTRLAASSEVAISLVTRNPDIEVLRRQLHSIRIQSYENWTCLIQDDASDAEYLASIATEITTSAIRPPISS